MGCRDYSEYLIRIYYLPPQTKVDTVDEAKGIISEMIREGKEEDYVYRECFEEYDGCSQCEYYKYLGEAEAEAIRESIREKRCILIDGRYDIGDDCDIANSGRSDRILVCNGEIRDKYEDEYEHHGYL